MLHEMAINVSLELEEGIANFDHRFAFFREVIGVSWKNFPENVHYFSEKRDKYNKPLYKNTGKVHDWRH